MPLIHTVQLKETKLINILILGTCYSQCCCPGLHVWFLYRTIPDEAIWVLRFLLKQLMYFILSF